MTSLVSNSPLVQLFRAPAKPAFDISPRVRAIVAIAATSMSLAVIYALFRGFTGLAPSHPNTRDLAIVLHVATVIPAIPLGGYLLLAPKGTKWHKLLGKMWVVLMVTTALSACFIKYGGGLDFHVSPIHIFVPLTLIASYKLIATARRGDMKGHKREILSLYLGALMIPGIVSMALPGRLMHTWLFV
ncbi:DUF2306 domain-containing protein [Erythrobacter sp. YT30]|uniref:DUF2306 domain-containing protein n=1 Tax=Erythrobacter sp. YT30 TaxID=1735012 RepID=UPI00076DD5D5|nr:DUF2306 domain-containing protein [Erythrobacter sp. YT30]KWV92362.1 hypothetical protein AUC45_11500 [Erythrobacter sp. YT30]